jgi:hypothetical protein
MEWNSESKEYNPEYEEWNSESRERDLESKEWTPKSKDLMHYHTWSDVFIEAETTFTSTARCGDHFGFQNYLTYVRSISIWDLSSGPQSCHVFNHSAIFNITSLVSIFESII